MRITRRNTLVVLLVLVAAGGIVGTGAFSQVSADRSVTVDTATDSNAQVQFEINTADHPGLTDTGSNTIGFDFDNINLDAETTYNDVLNVTVNDGSQGGTYDIEVSNTPSDINVSFGGANDDKVTGVSPGAVQKADIIIDTEGDTSTGTEVDDSITFTVTRN